MSDLERIALATANSELRSEVRQLRELIDNSQDVDS